ncbi:glycosyltransferase [Niallia sp. 03091]|uniref:glycosyltransferase n=1 Tax=Niallia sp. 03091 TaxID=3458059 RepID=UPI0040443C13
MRASVIIPSYNAMERLYYNLESLNYQDYPFEEFEVIVIDNGSNDNTGLMLKKFQSKYVLKTVRLKKNKGIANGRNKGILKATGDILIFHDSDMIAAKDFVRKHIEAHQDENTVICGMFWKRIFSFYYKYFHSDQYNHFQQFKDRFTCDGKAKKNKTPLIPIQEIINGTFMHESFDLDNEIIASLKETLQNYGEELDGYPFSWRYFLTNNSSVSRNKVMEVGLFDDKNENWGFEDIDLAFRLYKAGCKFKVRQDIVNVHQEHPLQYSLPQYVNSLHYMFEKYNDIKYLDMLLILLIITTSTIPPVKPLLDEKKLNELIIEIKEMAALNNHVDLLHLFRELVQFVRKKHMNQIKPEKLSRLKEYLSTVQQQEEKLSQELKKPYFMKALFALIYELMNKDGE